MPNVQLLHNDDEVLDPTDSTLRTRGSVEIDGHQSGTWEEHRDGQWTAVVSGTSVSAGSRDALIEQIENRPTA